MIKTNIKVAIVLSLHIIRESWTGEKKGGETGKKDAQVDTYRQTGYKSELAVLDE